MHINPLRTKGSSLRYQGRNRMSCTPSETISVHSIKVSAVMCSRALLFVVLQIVFTVALELCVFSRDYCPTSNLLALRLPDKSLCRHCTDLQCFSSLSATSRWIRSAEHMLQHILMLHDAHSKNCWIHYGQQRNKTELAFVGYNTLGEEGTSLTKEVSPGS